MLRGFSKSGLQSSRSFCWVIPISVEPFAGYQLSLKKYDLDRMHTSLKSMNCVYTEAPDNLNQPSGLSKKSVSSLSFQLQIPGPCNSRTEFLALQRNGKNWLCFKLNSHPFFSLPFPLPLGLRISWHWMKSLDWSRVLNGSKWKVTEEQNVQSNWQKADGGLAWQGNSPEEQFFSANLERLANDSIVKSIFPDIHMKGILYNVAKATQWKLNSGDHVMLLGDHIIKLFPIHRCRRSSPLKYIPLSTLTHDSYFYTEFNDTVVLLI